MSSGDLALTAQNRSELVRQSSGEFAARYIRELIFEGRLAAGTHVPQDEIAQELQMSRIPIREALLALERQGWVRIERHRGAFVNALDPTSVHDHYELYGLIYGFASKRALERAPEELIEQLTPLAAEIAKRSSDPQTFGERAIAFHRTVITCARSPRITVALRAMSNLVPGDFFALVPGAIDAERTGLAAIFAALKNKDAEVAALEYAAMMRQVGGLVVDLFDQRGLFSHGLDADT